MNRFIGKVVDDLGNLLAAQADLNKKIKAAKKRIKAAAGASKSAAFEGDLFRAVVSDNGSYRLDMKAVRAKLSPQFISANERYVPKVDVKVMARSDEKVKVAA